MTSMKKTKVPVCCYAVVPGAPVGERIGLVHRGGRGHEPANLDRAYSDGRFMSDAETANFVSMMNRLVGVDLAEAETMTKAALGPHLQLVPKV